MSKILTDDEIIERGDLSVRRRIRTELSIIHRIIKTLAAAGYTLIYSDGEDEYCNQTEQAGVNTLTACDEGRIFLELGGKSSGWVYFVLGNDGPDVVNDYTTNLEQVLKPVFDWISKQEATGKF